MPLNLVELMQSVISIQAGKEHPDHQHAVACKLIVEKAEQFNGGACLIPSLPQITLAIRRFLAWSFMPPSSI